MKRVVATAFIFLLLVPVFFGLLYFSASWLGSLYPFAVSHLPFSGQNLSSDGSPHPFTAHNLIAIQEPALVLYSALAALLGAFIFTMPFFGGGWPAFGDFLKRLILMMLALLIPFPVLLRELIYYNEALTAYLYPRAVPEKAAWQDILGTVSNGFPDGLSDTIILALAGAGAFIFVLSCFSDRVSVALLGTRQWITVFTFLGYGFAVLFKPVLMVFAALAGFFIGASSGVNPAMGNQHQRQEAAQSLSRVIRHYLAENGYDLVLTAGLITFAIACYLAFKITFSGALPWCCARSRPLVSSPAKKAPVGPLKRI